MRFPGLLLKAFSVLVCLSAYSHTASSQPLASPPSFESFLAERFKPQPSWDLESFCPVTKSVVAARVFRAYGSMFVASDSVKLPPVCVYPGDAEVVKFQGELKTKTFEAGGVRISLQEAASDALQRALNDANACRLTISPLDGAIAGSRSYGDTLMLWNGRFFRALDHWTRVGKLTAADREAVTGVELAKRIEMILRWEDQGIYFSTDRTRSILTSTAPPGASQHLSMLAFDVVEYSRPAIREIMNRNGWFQTVVDDPPHFTFLGIAEAELPNRGLKVVQKGSHRYWVPNLASPMR